MPERSAESVFDIFISYSSEDRETAARPIADALRARGFSVWFDDDAIGAGDDLQHAIMAGVRNARYGVIIISRSYLAKDWPRIEMMTLWTHEARVKRTIVLPVLHGLSSEELVTLDRAFEDRSMPSTARGVDYVVDRITAVIHRQDGADVQPIGHITPQKRTWWSVVRDYASLPWEAGGITPQLRGIWSGLKVALAYNGGIWAVLLGECIVLAVDWRTIFSQARLLLRDMTVVSYITVSIMNLLLIYLWVRIVWWLRGRQFTLLLTISVLYSVIARVASIPIATIVVRQRFPDRSLLLHACWGAVAGSGVILFLFWSGKFLILLMKRTVRRYIQAAA